MTEKWKHHVRHLYLAPVYFCRLWRLLVPEHLHTVHKRRTTKGCDCVFSRRWWITDRLCQFGWIHSLSSAGHKARYGDNFGSVQVGKIRFTVTSSLEFGTLNSVWLHSRNVSVVLNPFCFKKKIPPPPNYPCSRASQSLLKPDIERRIADAIVFWSNVHTRMILCAHPPDFSKFVCRLNAFGYLTLNEIGMTNANFGLQDQMMALRWIQENIRQFGGDPNQVSCAMYRNAQGSSTS